MANEPQAISNDTFDPYHKWLGIPPEDQPPDHYRLLGLKPLEQDPDVIHEAADQRMAHVRSHQTGQHAEDSQRLLNELSKAKVCLLNPSRKARYDEELRKHLASPSTAAMPALDDLLGDLPAASAPVAPLTRKQRRRRRVPVSALFAAAMAGGLLVLVAVVTIQAKRESPEPPTETVVEPEQPHSTPVPQPSELEVQLRSRLAAMAQEKTDLEAERETLARAIRGVVRKGRQSKTQRLREVEERLKEIEAERPVVTKMLNDEVIRQRLAR